MDVAVLLTIVFALVYLVLYPGLGSYAGKLRLEPAGEYKAELAQAAGELRRRCTPASRRRTCRASWPPTRRRMAIGERLFLNNCAQCHGSDARGSKGFPEPDRQRLAVRRRAGDDQGDHHAGPQRHDAADGRRGRQRRGRARTSRTTC